MNTLGPKLLLFDIDGTLLLSDGAGGRAMHRAGQQLFGEGFRFDVDTAGKLDTQIYTELAQVNAQFDMNGHHERFRETYVTLLETDLRENNRAYTLPGVEALLGTLVTYDVTLGLLTGNYGPSAFAKLQAVGLEPELFPVSAFGDEAATRPGLPPLAMNRYTVLTGEVLEPQQVVVIGDTPKDIDCAHANGCVAFGVATGRYSAQDLAAAGADVLVEDLSDPAPLLDLLG